MSFVMSLEQMKEELKKRLKPSRFRHSLGVEETAVFLADRFGVDEEQARVAGLLHDCAREFRNEDMVKEAEKRGIAIGEVERSMPLLLHADIGAQRVREIYGVDDKDVSQAIARHTVGGPQMTKLDKIIWYADMIEPAGIFPVWMNCANWRKQPLLTKCCSQASATPSSLSSKKGILCIRRPFLHATKSCCPSSMKQRMGRTADGRKAGRQCDTPPH